MLFACWLLPPIGKEQPGDRPELQTEDIAAASGARTNWAQGDAGTAHWQIWVHWGSQISCHEWYASPMSEHAHLHSFSLCFFYLVLFLSRVPRQCLSLHFFCFSNFISSNFFLTPSSSSVCLQSDHTHLKGMFGWEEFKECKPVSMSGHCLFAY